MSENSASAKKGAERTDHIGVTVNTKHPMFFPLNRAEADALGWDRPDFVYVCGDAYVDHPSFGTAIISRVLADAGFRIAILAQPDYRTADSFKEFGRPRLGFLVSAGNLDSMVANYSASKHKRGYDYYSPGGKAGLRPDRAVIVYCNRVREAYGDVPIVIGGLEASLRRFAHYDYWDDKVRRSILVDSRADLLSYGMGERALVRIAELLDKGVPVKKIRDVRGTVYLAPKDDPVHFEAVGGFDYDTLKTDKKAYSEAFGLQYREQDSVRGRAVTEIYGDKMLVQNPPQPPLERSELDKVYSLPYARAYHPSYDAEGGIPAIEEVRFSITHNRGCFGGCAFCAIAFHQGRAVRSRSIESVMREAEKIIAMPDFKGYIHDVGGPTANFRYPSCRKQLTDGVCAGRRCLAPKPCPNLEADESEYLTLLRRLRELPGVKKVFVRSGIRFDYMLADKRDDFFRELVTHHVSGQLKVAPEHICDGVLRAMGKPSVGVYEQFCEKFFRFSREAGKEQYLVPYLMSGHPGSTLSDAVKLAKYLKDHRLNPEQVQEFYPTPGTLATVMYYTGIDPLSGKDVHVIRDPHEKALARALLQYGRPENADKVREALRLTGNENIIGSTPECLVRPGRGGGTPTAANVGRRDSRGGDKSSGKKGAPNAKAQSGGRRGERGSSYGTKKNTARKPPRGAAGNGISRPNAKKGR